MNIMPWYYFTTPSERIYWVYLITSLLLALILLIIENRTFPSSKTILAWLKHPDTRLDVVYFLVSWFIKMLIIAPLLISAHAGNAFYLPLFESLDFSTRKSAFLYHPNGALYAKFIYF
ncbi:Uncharacterised protein [Suttonella ornithocola]|uniref:Uncharacterized protein n=1 Tax=Suttonella ornithocola TaxID=279832 RepID=A0A380MVG7_9GAMM|nr:Uncharacterised protein [Suttonella ornithocola]